MYTYTMEDIARGVLEGIAIGSFFAVVVEANRLALKTLWRFNRLAAEPIFDISTGFRFCNKIRELQQRLDDC